MILREHGIPAVVGRIRTEAEAHKAKAEGCDCGSRTNQKYSERGKASYMGKWLAVLESLDRNMNSIQRETRPFIQRKEQAPHDNDH